MEAAMSEPVDQFCDDLRDRLTRIESRVIEIKTKIESDREATKTAIDSKVSQARASLEARRDDANAARARMKERLEEKKAETENNIAEWKRSHDSDRLQRRSEDAEIYAAWATMVVADAIDEADLATMEAIAARLDFEMVASS
jgi:chromosome segregation ATPase